MRVKLASLITSALLLASTATHAAPPQTLNYQGYLTSSSGTAVNTGVSITFRLYTSASGGPAVWAESQNVTVSNGNFSVVLGNAAPFGLDFSSPYFLGVQVEADPEMTPRQPLTASPYALKAVSSDSLATGATVSGAQLADASVTSAKLAASGCSSGQVLVFSGSAWNCGAAAGPPGPAGPAGPQGPAGPSDVTGNITLVTSSASAGNILKDGAVFIHNTGFNSTYVGVAAGNLSMTGTGNTALGANAMTNNTSGFASTAVGVDALRSNFNGSNNTALGESALKGNTTGSGNVALGGAALFAVNSGSHNIAVGQGAGFNLVSGDNNIAIGNIGVATESGTIRIGDSQHNRAFIAGIRGVTPGVADGLPVIVDSAGQLGTAASLGGSGTVTSVATGAGLAGGPITSTGTINLAATQLMPTTACASGEIAKWNGSSWACAADANTVPAAACTGGSFLQWNGTSWVCTTPAVGSGTVTSITAGAGLTGGTITGSGTIAIDPASATLAGNYFKRGGNAFGATAVIGTSDIQNLALTVGGRVAVRYEPTGGTPNVIAGATQNFASSAVGATIAGGGEDVGGGPPGHNEVSASYGTVGGGWKNWVRGSYGTVAGGGGNEALGNYSTVPGGFGNIAMGANSFAAGSQAFSIFANGAASDGTFIWADYQFPHQFRSVAANEFAARASGGFRFVTAINGSGNPTRTTAINPNGELDFGSATRQMLKLWGGEAYGIGIQSDTLYQRSNKHYAWYVGGTHDDAMLASGVNGVVLMTLTNGSVASPPAVTGIARAQAFTATSDRAAKESFEAIDSNELLDALSKMPVQSWKYRNEDQTVRHIGPTAQDFRAAFGVGYDDKTIATVDADGVALAAIQGLHKMVKEKDEKIRKLEAALEEIRARLGMK